MNSPTLNALHPSAGPRRSVGVRVAAGVFAVIPAVMLQATLASDAPIRFSPLLVVALLAAWWGGRAAGLAVMFTALFSINYVILEPTLAWSTGREELATSFTLVLVVAGAMLCATRLRARFDQLHAARLEAERVCQEEKLRIAALEADYEQRSAAMQRHLGSAKAYANACERVERYAKAIELRLAELQTGLQEFPVPLALITQEQGVLVLRAASAALYESSQLTPNHEAAVRDALGSVLTDRGQPFKAANHPLTRALNGEAVVGEQVVWCNQGHMQLVQLYAKRVANNRMLAVALVPLPSTERPRSLN